MRGLVVAVLGGAVAMVSGAAWAEAPYKFDEAFCQRYSRTLSEYAPEYYYRACLKLEEWERVHPNDAQVCIETSRHPDPQIGYALCLQSARSNERMAQRRKCEQDAENTAKPPSPAFFMLMMQCENLTKD